MVECGEGVDAALHDSQGTNDFVRSCTNSR
jgi:hypothetical protein